MMAKTPLSREQRVTRISLTMGILGGLLAVMAAVALGIGLRGTTDQFDFIKGLGIGMFTALPFFFAVMAYRAMSLMDEYARLLQRQALAFAFMVTMIVSGGLIALQSYLHFNLPAWIIYATGMLTWAIAAAVQGIRAGRER